MKKLLLLLAMLCACVFASAQNEDVEKAYTLAFEKDHTEFKDMVTTMRLWKRMGKIYTGTYDEKTAFTASKENKEKVIRFTPITIQLISTPIPGQARATLKGRSEASAHRENSSPLLYACSRKQTRVP